MDPLSITTSAITLLGAAIQCARGLEELKSTKRLPSAFSSLLAEVSDLQHELERCLSTVQASKHISARLHSSGVLKCSEAAKTKLELLRQMVAPDTSRNGFASSKELRAFWTALVHGKTRLCSARDELRDLRLALASSLNFLTAPIVCGIDAKIDGLVEAQKDLYSLQQRFVQGVITLGSNLNTAVLQEPSFAGPIPCAPGSPPDTSLPLLTAMTRKQGQNSLPRALVAKDVRLPPDRLGKNCLPWCSCRCHATSYVNSFESLRDLLGYVSISHSGMPGLAKPCDQKQSCRRRMPPKLSMRYRLPRAIANFQFLTCSFSTLAGPELRVKLPRLVGWTSPVWQYATTGNVEAVQRLFRAGLASPWDVSPIGETLLHYATNHWNAELCHLLLDADLDPNDEDDLRNTGVCVAWERVLSGKMSANEASIVAGLFRNTDYLSTRSFTVIHKIVLGLVSKDLSTELRHDTKEIDSKDSRGRTAVSWAAARGDESALQTLLFYGADPNIADIQGNCPLHFVQNTACAEILLQYKADIRALNCEKQTPLYTTCRAIRSASLTEYLLKAGSEVNAVDGSDQTALHTAYGEPMPFIEVLLDAGADINARNSSADTPLRFAIFYNWTQLLQRMLYRHPEANFGLINYYGQSFAHAVARTANAETMRMLSNAQPETLRPDLDMRDNAGKTAAEYFADRVKHLEDDNVAELEEAYGNFVIAVSGPLRTEDSSPVAIALQDRYSNEKLDFRIVAAETIGDDDDDDAVADVFHDAFERMVVVC